MAKWAFDDNVPKVRPRLRGGRGAETTLDLPTEPPPARTAEEPVPEPDGASSPEPAAHAPEARRRSLVRDLIATSDELTANNVETHPDAAPEPVEAAGPIATAAAVPPKEPVADPFIAELAEVEPAPPDDPEPAPVPETKAVSESPEPEPVAAPTRPRPAAAEPITIVPLADPDAYDYPAPRPRPAAPIAQADAVVAEEDTATRRASLRRRAAGLGALAEPPPARPAVSLDALADAESAAELAVELERALTDAAEANERLRRDLGAALDDLARSSADARRLGAKVEKLETEARDRARVVQELVGELELLEGERDSALAQSSDGSLELEALEEKLHLAERRAHELERSAADAQARARRHEELAAAHAAQRAALRAELDTVRRERDQLLAQNVELQREKEELAGSRRALDEVHRALNDARLRAQRIRPR